MAMRKHKVDKEIGKISAASTSMVWCCYITFTNEMLEEEYKNCRKLDERKNVNPLCEWLLSTL